MGQFSPPRPLAEGGKHRTPLGCPRIQPIGSFERPICRAEPLVTMLRPEEYMGRLHIPPGVSINTRYHRVPFLCVARRYSCSRQTRACPLGDLYSPLPLAVLIMTIFTVVNARSRFDIILATRNVQRSHTHRKSVHRTYSHEKQRKKRVLRTTTAVASGIIVILVRHSLAGEHPAHRSVPPIVRMPEGAMVNDHGAI